MRATEQRSGLRSRLLALVLVPTVIASFLAGSNAVDKRDEAEVAAVIHDQVATLTALVDLRTEMMSARIPVEVEVRSAQLGLDTSDGFKLLKLDGNNFGSLDQVKAKLRSIPSQARPFTAVQLADLQHLIDDHAGLRVIDGFDSLEMLTDETWGQEYDRVERQLDSLANPVMGEELRDLNASAYASSSLASMMTGLADYWFSTLSKSPRLDASRVKLGDDAARFGRLTTSLAQSSDAEVGSAAIRLRSQYDAGAFSAAIDDAAEGRPAEPLVGGVDVDLMIKTFTDSFRLVEPMLAIMDGRASALESSVRSFTADARKAVAISLTMTLLMVVVLPALCLVVAASFERPLRRLIEGQRRVGNGELDVEPLSTGGPPEIAAATIAFNDVVENLRLLEEKVNALAAADFEHPSLAAALPGDLGDTLGRSVEVLTASIQERTVLQERLEHQATHDLLTGIRNRAGGVAALEAALARARRNGTSVAVAFLDLDGFKKANDTYGHRVGDQVLQAVAARLQEQARAGDTCARLGGDEFIVIAENIEAPSDALTLADRISSAIAVPIRAGETTISITASIGVALAADGLEPPLDLIAHADVAAYEAKRTRTGVALFNAHHQLDIAVGRLDDAGPMSGLWDASVVASEADRSN